MSKQVKTRQAATMRLKEAKPWKTLKQDTKKTKLYFEIEEIGQNEMDHSSISSSSSNNIE